MLEWKRGGLTQDILDKFAVIRGRTGPEPVMGCVFDPKDTVVADWLDDEWYCVLPEIVIPKQSNRFGLKVGDKVTFGTHDGKQFSGSASGTHVIASINDTYSDGTARLTLGDVRGDNWHPYWFGLCRSDGSPLPPKPATKTIMLEEWCVYGSDRAIFEWHVVGRQIGKTDTWFKTGVTRELEVPND